MDEKQTKQETNRGVARAQRRFVCCLIVAVALIALSGVAIVGYLVGAFVAVTVMGIGLGLLVVGTLVLLVSFFGFTGWLKRSLGEKEKPHNDGEEA